VIRNYQEPQISEILNDEAKHFPYFIASLLPYFKDY